MQKSLPFPTIETQVATSAVQICISKTIEYISLFRTFWKGRCIGETDYILSLETPDGPSESSLTLGYCICFTQFLSNLTVH